MTWMVATIVIIVILIISVYITSALAITKKAIIYKESERTTDLLLEKSLFAYFLSGENPSLLIKLEQKEFYVDFEDKLNEIGDNTNE